MNCRTVQALVHQYLDGDLDKREELKMREHLSICSDCNQHFLELEKAIALVRSLHHLRTSDDFTEKVLSRLPQEKKRRLFSLWMKRHPVLVAASLFFALMLGSTTFSWYGDREEFQILSNPTHLVPKDGFVHVPEGEVIEGDLIVRHGDIRVDGEVRGDVIAIDGKVLLSSTAHITGETEEINQLLDWVWYKVKTFITEVVTP